MTSLASNIPYGHCHCGCGEKTKLIKVANTKRRYKIGDVYRFVWGHQKRLRSCGFDAAPFKLRGVYCRVIYVRDGIYVIVNASDYSWLCQYKWHLKRNRDGKLYVVRSGLKAEGWRGQQIAMHRFILELDPFNPLEGDHIDGNCLDNSRLNLRPANDEDNARNCKLRINNTSGCSGITKRPNGSHRVRINVGNGKRICLGDYADFAVAVQVRKAAEEKYYGEFARSK